MADMQVRCGYCKGEFWSKKVNVYVFKERQCPKCSGSMFAFNKKRILVCRKCKHKVSMDDDLQLGKMPVSIRGTSRTKKIMRQMMRKGIEIDKKVVPKHRYCQRCRNLQNTMNQRLRAAQLKRGTRELPIEDAKRILKYHVLRQLQKEQQTKRIEEKNKKDVKVKVSEEQLKEQMKKLKDRKLSKEELKEARKTFREKLMGKK